MKLLLFRLGARARRQGGGGESIRRPALPPSANWWPGSRKRGEGYAYAFENPKVIRAAIDRNHVRADARIEGAREIAFFPPMTGG